MASSTGVNASAGTVLTDWSHVQQSIATILTTPIGSRIMRRDFGSNLFDLIDAKMVQKNVLAVYSATALAIARWEPRFRVTKASIDELSAAGRLVLNIFGTYFPRGHLGDYSIAEDGVVRVVLGGRNG
ncbi:GPW/gp25 family protein [Aquamicrobium terrae]